MAFDMILRFLSVFIFFSLSTSLKLYLCNSLQTWTTQFRCYFISVVVVRVSSLSEAVSRGLLKVVWIGLVVMMAGDGPWNHQRNLQYLVWIECLLGFVKFYTVFGSPAVAWRVLQNRVCPSFRPTISPFVLSSGRFLWIISLNFSKFWYGARNP